MRGDATFSGLFLGALETSENRTQKQLGNPTSIEAASLELAAIESVGAISSLGGRAID